MDTIKNRRTIRKYKKDEIPASLINGLLEKAFRSSTMGNMQLYSVIVTRDQKMKEKLAPAHFNQPMVTGAPVVLTFCADFNRFTKWCDNSDAVAGYDNFLSFMNAATDTLLVSQTFCDLAEANGLGICYLGTTIYNSGDIVEILNLPRLVMPITTVTVGYPDEMPEQQDRLDPNAMIHEEVYHDYSSDDIRKLYAYKESLKDNIGFVKENNKKNLAQVYTDVRYTKEANEAISKTLKEVLSKQGF